MGLNGRAAPWVLWALVALFGCAEPLKAPKTAEQVQEEAAAAYEHAVDAFLAQDWEIAAQRLAEVRKNYSYTRYARLAELRLADSAFRQDKFAEASAAYKRFASDYPSDPEVPYARYRAVRSQFLQAGSSIFQPPLEERDLNSVRSAWAEIRVFLEDFPDYPEQEELAYMLEAATGTLARHELYVARFYLNTGRYEPAVARAEEALLRFGRSGLEPEAYTLLGETYLKMHDHKKAVAQFKRVLTDFPESPFVVPAQNFLDFANAQP
jgi:outer membrane protein assembly factor BamD